MNAKGTQTIKVATSLDLKGKACPLPIVKTSDPVGRSCLVPVLR